MARNQINVTLTEDDLSRVDEAVQRFFKRDRSTIMREIFDIFFDSYLEAEEARLSVLQQSRAHFQQPAKEKPKKL